MPVDPAAPAITAPPPAPATSMTADPAQPAPGAPAAALNIPKITVNMDDAPKSAPIKNATDSVSATASSAPRSERATKQANAKIAAAPPMEEPAPITAEPVEAVQAPLASSPVVPPAPIAQPVTVPPTANSQTANDLTEEALPIAGGVLGALALIGGAFAFSSRRRRARQTRHEQMNFEEPLTLTDPVQQQPVMAHAPVRAPATSVPATELPAGFAMSRFGPHVQAAYKGPTPENPSLSLRRRLKRARFYDQRARIGAQEWKRADAMASPAAPAAKPARQPEYVTARRFSGGSPAFRPAFQN